jgi:isochorismate pyruvate lyase
MKETIAPEDCRSMEEVRSGVDTLDRALVTLLARRFAYMRAAARIKPDREDVRDEPRKTEVIANASAEAEKLGAPAGAVAELWDRIVELSIAYEMDEFDRLRGA